MTTTRESDDERDTGIREDTTEKDPEFLRQRNAEEYAHRFPTYWKRSERDEWRWLQALRYEDLPEDPAPAQLRLSELRRILATVDALEKALADVLDLGDAGPFGYDEGDQRIVNGAEALLAALEAK